MATLNDYKLLNSKCKAYFKLLETELGREIQVPTDKHIERFGFYLFMLESVCGIKDTSDILKLIVDTEFNKVVFNNAEDDLGIDAIHIDDEESYVNLFNFKFRESFNLTKSQGVNETFLSTKFINIISTEKTNNVIGSLKNKLDEILQKLYSNEIWKMRLYVISNDNVELDVNTIEIRQLKDLYDLEVVPISLDSISKMMSLRPKAINAIIHLGKNSILPFVETSLSSSVSYIIRISADDLVRITCDNEGYRNNYMMEDFAPLSTCQMDFNLLFDNVRGFIVRSKFNDNIFATLKDDPSKFFMYNNGLTITASDIISEDTNANKKVKLTINDFQVVNGGQTLRTLHKFNQLDRNNITKYLSNCEILLRVFKTPIDNMVRNKIAEYTNSQNSISTIDLKSLSSEQIMIEQFLEENNIIYARKIGDVGFSNEKPYIHKISMEKFGQILFSIKGSPEKASNQKKQIFDKYYNDIFGTENFDVSKATSFITKYFEVKKFYDTNTHNYETTDQKVFYILYLDEQMEGNTEYKIHFLEDVLNSYSTTPSIPNARKLIQAKFKDFLDERIKKINI